MQGIVQVRGQIPTGIDNMAPAAVERKIGFQARDPEPLGDPMAAQLRQKFQPFAGQMHARRAFLLEIVVVPDPVFPLGRRRCLVSPLDQLLVVEIADPAAQ